MNIEHYMTDGANYQAQAVLVFMRGIMHQVVDNEDRIRIEVGRFENCREQGYVVSVVYNYCVQIAHYAFFEHRNSDNIVIFKFKGQFINTPLIDEVFGERGKYDYDKAFEWGEIKECAEWIVTDMEKEVKQYIEENPNLNTH